jgi:hypothetical protein
MVDLCWYIQPISHDYETSQRIAYLAQERGVQVISECYPGFNSLDWNSILPVKPTLFLGSISAKSLSTVYFASLYFSRLVRLE